MPESARPPLVPHTPQSHRRRFYHRFLQALALSGGLIAGSLGLGVLGYHFIAQLGWVDAVLNAAMILTGMGPVAPLTTTAAKLFASAYALFSGLVFITATGIMLAPVFHRVLHKFQLDERDLR